MLHVTSLHTSRIGWESSIFGNQRNSSGLQIVSDFGDYEELCAEAVLARRESLFRVFACRRINVAPPMVSLPQSAMREPVGCINQSVGQKSGALIANHLANAAFTAVGISCAIQCTD
jgi:hypothetical protein